MRLWQRYVTANMWFLLDEQEKPGGQVWRAKDSSILSAPQTPEGSAGDALRAEITKAQIDHRGSTQIWQIERQSESWDVHAVRDGEVEKLTSKTLVLATGAREFVQPIPRLDKTWRCRLGRGNRTF